MWVARPKEAHILAGKPLQAGVGDKIAPQAPDPAMRAARAVGTITATSRQDQVARQQTIRRYQMSAVTAMKSGGATDILALLGKDAEALLRHVCKTIPRESLHLPGPDFVDRVLSSTDRSPSVMRAMQQMFDHGRLAGTGYLSILPVDQGIEHSAGASFAKNPAYFDPENIVKLAIEGGCNAVASTLGVLGACARKYAHKIPFLLKFNHNEFLTYPNKYDQIFFASIRQARDMGAVAVGATIYFGSPESGRQLVEVSEAFQAAHELGMATVLWCYLRNPAFKSDKDYHVSADLTGQANHLGVTIEADIIKQKLPENNGGYNALNTKENPYGKTDKRIYSELTTEHPIDLCRYQVANCYLGRAGLINSGGASGENDLVEAVRTAVINKRAGGMGLISGRKAFQRPMKDGVAILNAIQDVYLSRDVTIA
jgi:class I fructose-bisphosphate aldolase